ncbi:MAG: hypothetical protein V8R82_02295 [Clostridia bacterium]
MKIRTSRGITIIALVITIIVLLILAGVSVGTLSGENGLFYRAKQAKLETKRGDITEWLNLKLLEEQTNNPTGTSEDILKATRENVVNNQNELKQKGKVIEIQDITDEEEGQKVDLYFYVIVDDDVYKVELVGAKFIGNLKDFPPRISIENINNTTNSITVKVTTKRNQGGKIEYYIKKEEENDYQLKSSQEEENYTFSQLAQNKKYNIKIVAVAKNGKTAEVLVDRTTGSVVELTKANTKFTYVPEQGKWTNQDVKVTAIPQIDITGYTLQTSKDGKKWSAINNQTFTENGTMYVILYDGTNYGGSATANVTNIDKIKPIVTEATATTNSITITATDEASGIIGYAITTSNSQPTSFTGVGNTKNFSTTVGGKKQGTTYYVWVKDAAGNVSTSRSTATGNVTGLTSADTTFSYNPTGWTNGNVTATASTTKTGYTLQTSKDGQNWSSTASQTYSENGKIYARLWDGTNGGGYAAGNVTNIDKVKPVVTGATATTNSITITATDEASGIIGYAITTSNSQPTSFTGVGNTKNFSTTVRGKKQGTTYYVWVKDAAGNVSTSRSTATGNVTGLTSADTTFSYNPTGWTNGNVTATASTTKTGYTLQTSKDGQNWSSTASQTYSENGKIYARLWDGTNGGGYAAGNVTNIDKVKPVVTGATATTNSITITATDEASGIIGYTITTSNSQPTSFTGVGNTKNFSTTVGGKKQGTTYYVWVKDAAGNVSTSRSTATGNVTGLTSADTTFSYNPTGWTNGNVTATASTTKTGYTLQTSKDGQNWSSTASQTYSENGKIYARLWDGTNGGGYAAGNVTNIDKVKPVVTGATATTNSITITATDEASGIIGYTITTSNSQPTSFTGVGNTKNFSTTVGGKKQGTTYYVWVKDAAGNVSTSRSTATGNVTGLTSADTTFSYNPTGWTNGNVTATASTTKTGYTLQTSKDGQNWSSTASQTYSENGKIYARLWDGTNGGGYAAGNVTNIDKVKPVVTGATATTNSITITATDEASGIIGYAITTSNSQPTSFTGVGNTKNFSTTVRGKKQGTTYYVWVKDAAGNVSTSRSTATGNVTGLTSADTTFSYNPTGWTNGNVTATASTTKTGYTLQTSKDGQNWSSTASQTYSENGKIYARLWDGTNGGGYAAGNVTNIDKVKPSIGTISGSNTASNVGTISVSNISETGGSGIAGYYVSTNSNKPTATSVTWKGLSSTSFAYNVSSNGTYYVWVKDKAGNVSDTKSCTISGIVSKVTSATYSGGSILIGNYITPSLSYSGTPKSKTFSSLNTGIATVNSRSGQVYGVAAGTATIRVVITNYDGTSVTKTCTVTVESGVAKIGNKQYSTVTNAVNDSSSGATVYLLKDLTESVTVPSNKNLTLNLNGKTLRYNGQDTIYNYGTLTITNGTINSISNSGISNAGTLNLTSSSKILGNAFGLVVNGGSAYINNSYIKSTLYDGILFQNSAQNLEIVGGTIEAHNHGINDIGSGKIIIQGTRITGGLYGIYYDGTGSVEVKGDATIRGNGYDGIAMNGNGNLKISGGTISGKNYAVYRTKGTITMTGGTLIQGSLGTKYGW